MRERARESKSKIDRYIEKERERSIAVILVLRVVVRVLVAFRVLEQV